MSEQSSRHHHPGDIPDQLREATTAIMRWSSRLEVRRQLRGNGYESLSPTDTWLLEHLSTGGPTRASQLAEWQSVDRSTMTVQVRRLELRGLICRQPDPADKRAHLIALTEHGHAVCAANVDAARNVFAQAVRDWPVDEQRILAQLLVRYAESLPHLPGGDSVAVEQAPCPPDSRMHAPLTVHT